MPFWTTCASGSTGRWTRSPIHRRSDTLAHQAAPAIDLSAIPAAQRAAARDDRPWGGEDSPGVVYFYAPGRASENAETFLTGFDGTLQIDGYTGYNRLAKSAGCSRAAISNDV